MRRAHGAALGAALLLGVACRPATPTVFARRRLPGPMPIELLYPYPGNAGDAVEAALPRVEPRLQRWGGLRAPVRLTVVPDHAALERAADKRGFGWLRAWARYDEVLVQHPLTWGDFRPGPRELEELLLHELTHCAMFQQAAGPDDWQRKRIPMWFREGMASVTAEQGHRWFTLEELARVYETEPALDPFRRSEALSRARSGLVYGAAHHAFAFLVRRYGDQGIRAVLAAMRAGPGFDEAFRSALGFSPDAFLSDFERYVRLRGFRHGRIRRPPAVESPPPAP